LNGLQNYQNDKVTIRKATIDYYYIMPTSNAYTTSDLFVVLKDIEIIADGNLVLIDSLEMPAGKRFLSNKIPEGSIVSFLATVGLKKKISSGIIEVPHYYIPDKTYKKDVGALEFEFFLKYAHQINVEKMGSGDTLMDECQKSIAAGERLSKRHLNWIAEITGSI
jgi:hypothetical protein